MHLIVVSSSFAQGLDTEQWMKELEDDMLVSSLSIPGAHDAATGEGLFAPPGFGRTQSLNLKELWECGVRAFDLRPAVNDTLLYIYHGSLRTKMSFTGALSVLSAQLDNYPSEFAIVLLREESDSENEAERALWPSLVGKSIHDMGERAAVFSPDMKLGDVRGKVIFLTRSSYIGTDKGAYVSGWNHSADGAADACITSYANGKTARLQVQDYYAPTDSKKRAAKKSVMNKYLAMAHDAPAEVWTVNFLSGYSTTWLGCTSLATTSGYKRNAEWLHPYVLERLKNDKRPVGILMMDYAGVDRVGGGLWHWKPFQVCGKEIVRAVIECNFNSVK